MAMTEQQQASELADLLRTCRDSLKAIEQAIELMPDEATAQRLHEYADEHRAAAEQLEAEIDRRGGEPPDDGSRMGILRRAWLEFSAEMTEHNVQTILSGLEKVQSHTVDVYEDYLLKDWPEDLLELLRRQYHMVRDGWQSIKSMYIDELNTPDF